MAVFVYMAELEFILAEGMGKFFFLNYVWKKRVLLIICIPDYPKGEGKKKALNFMNNKKLQDRNIFLVSLFLSTPMGYVHTLTTAKGS